MTLSERYKIRKTLKENDGANPATGDASNTQNADPKEKLEELRTQVISFVKSIKIKSLQNKFGEKLKEITASIANWEKIDLAEEWNKLSEKIVNFVRIIENKIDLNKMDDQFRSGFELLKKTDDQSSKIENIIKNFNDKNQLSDVFNSINKIWDLFENYKDEKGGLGSEYISDQRTAEDLRKSLESFVDDFEKRAKLDPAKIIKEAETLIEQTKTSMKALGKFLEEGKYVTNENKDKTLAEILKPAEGEASAPTAPAPAAAPAAA